MNGEYAWQWWRWMKIHPNYLWNLCFLPLIYTMTPERLIWLWRDFQWCIVGEGGWMKKILWFKPRELVEIYWSWNVECLVPSLGESIQEKLESYSKIPYVIVRLMKSCWHVWNTKYITGLKMRWIIRENKPFFKVLYWWIFPLFTLGWVLFVLHV